MLGEDLLCDLEEIEHFLSMLVSRSVQGGLTLQGCEYSSVAQESLQQNLSDRLGVLVFQEYSSSGDFKKQN